MANELCERWELTKPYDPDLIGRPSAAPSATMKRYQDLFAAKVERGDIPDTNAVVQRRMFSALIIRLGLEALEREEVEPERRQARLELDNLLADEQADRERDAAAAKAEAERQAQEAAERQARVDAEEAAEQQTKAAAEQAKADRLAAEQAARERVEQERAAAAERRRREARLAELRGTGAAPRSLSEQQAAHNQRRADELEAELDQVEQELANLEQFDRDELAKLDQQIAAAPNRPSREKLEQQRALRVHQNAGAIASLRSRTNILRTQIRAALVVH